MGGLFSFLHSPKQQFGFFDCSPGCRASDRDVRYCTCRCRGINHGALIHGRVIRPIPVPQGSGLDPSLFLEPEAIPQIAPQQALPNLQPSPSLSSRPQVPRTKGPSLGNRFGKTVGRSFKHALAGYSQAELNDSIWRGLHGQFNQDRINEIIGQAYAIRAKDDPYQNQPELYEMFETGDIDRALEHLGLRWVIGRPKMKPSRN